MRITLTADITFATGIEAKAGEVLVFTAPDALELHKADGTTVTPIDLSATPANIGSLLSLVAPATSDANSYALTKTMKFPHLGFNALTGDFFAFDGKGTVTISRAGVKQKVVSFTKQQLDWLVFIGTLTPLA